MKLTAALYLLIVSSSAIAAPASAGLHRLPRPADSINSSLPQEPKIKLAVHAPDRSPNSVSGNRGLTSGRIDSGNERPLLPSDGAASTSSKKKSPHKPKPKPNPKPKPESSYLVSLAHRLTNGSPFSESSIVREETRASTEDWEPEATIVEWETKASRDAYIWIPSFSTDKTIHYHRVRVCTDMLVVSLALSVVAVILVVELWKPVATRFRRLRSGHGPIYLEVNEVISKENWMRKTCPACGPAREFDVGINQEIGKAEVATTRE
ncbi:hypothetical protein NUW58_g9211 [Xylaria curta]|uniref:Uncharacterized protein n=1 Tax=Xylaria curta TaxID=42375 RepID=A0ACC1MZX3_9PEZI|nr:hypothetical protein NUW58_g9211 [Xylaria curta]